MAMPDLKSSIQHYNEIPFQCIKDAESILDIGSSNGVMAKFSNYSHLFDKINESGNYLGIDIQQFSYIHYLIKQIDFLVFEPTRKYDLVLALHIIEHFDIQQWPLLFNKLYNCVSNNGYLIVNTPFKQKKCLFKGKHDFMRHKVFQIDKKLFEQFLSNGHFNYSKEKLHHFRDKDESLPYAILRFFYRIITNHPYSIFKCRMYSQRIIGVWRKNGKRKD